MSMLVHYIKFNLKYILYKVKSGKVINCVLKNMHILTLSMLVSRISSIVIILHLLTFRCSLVDYELLYFHWKLFAEIILPLY